jgi:hypothetical protein
MSSVSSIKFSTNKKRKNNIVEKDIVYQKGSSANDFPAPKINNEFLKNNMITFTPIQNEMNDDRIKSNNNAKLLFNLANESVLKQSRETQDLERKYNSTKLELNKMIDTYNVTREELDLFKCEYDYINKLLIIILNIFKFNKINDKYTIISDREYEDNMIEYNNIIKEYISIKDHMHFLSSIYNIQIDKNYDLLEFITSELDSIENNIHKQYEYSNQIKRRINVYNYCTFIISIILIILGYNMYQDIIKCRKVTHVFGNTFNENPNEIIKVNISLPSLF